MNAENDQRFLTAANEDDLLLKIAEAYRRTEAPESEEWVRKIAEKTSLLLSAAEFHFPMAQPQATTHRDP